MIFTSEIFLFFFFPLFFAAYYLFGRKNIVILLFSLIFYFWTEQWFILVLLFSTILDFLVSIWITRYRLYDKYFLALSILVNFSVLIWFKINGFFTEEIIELFPLNNQNNSVLFEHGIPLGVSFYTFQSVSYTIDVYRREIKPCYSVKNFLTYIAMFPQIIAGPIVRYTEVENELTHRKISLESFYQGLIRFMIGFSKKVLIANNIASMTHYYLQGQELTFYECWLTYYAFMVQLYFDFSAYSDMAIGLGGMIGFKFPENFEYCFRGKSMGSFWRHWHLTFYRWIKDYIYKPLLTRGVKKDLAIFLTFAFAGLWHGAGWNFLIWGIYYGIISILESRRVIRIQNNLLGRIYIMTILCIGNAFITSSSVDLFTQRILTMLSFSIMDYSSLAYLSQFTLPMAYLGLGTVIIYSSKLTDFFRPSRYINMAHVVFFCFALTDLFYQSYSPFYYFRF